MKMKQVLITTLVLGLLAVCVSTVRAQTPPSIPIGLGQTGEKPESKLWYTDDGPTWWAILGDGASTAGGDGVAGDIYFYKLVNDALVKQSFTDALVDTNISARADVLWDADESVLYVLMYSGTTARFSKYDYTPGTQTYTRQTGYPRHH